MCVDAPLSSRPLSRRPPPSSIGQAKGRILYTFSWARYPLLLSFPLSSYIQLLSAAAASFSGGSGTPIFLIRSLAASPFLFAITLSCFWMRSAFLSACDS